MSVVRREVSITNQRGLHARASAKFVTAVSELDEGTEVRVARNGSEASGGSILGLMMLGAAKGDSVEIIVEGEDRDAVLERLCTLVEDGFGEE